MFATRRCRRSSAIHGWSREIENSTGWIGANCVIYNGVDTEDYHPRLAAIHRDEIRHRLGITENAPLLLYVGSGYERKGVPQLLPAFATLKRRDAQLVIIGADRKLHATKTTQQPALD